MPALMGISMSDKLLHNKGKNISCFDKRLHLYSVRVTEIIYLWNFSCLEALRHPFLCGPRWRVDPSMDIIRWGLGSTAVRITEEYIYGWPQVYGFLSSMLLLVNFCFSCVE